MKYLTSLIVLTILIACQQNQVVRYSTDSAEVEATKALISHYENAEWDQWLSAYSDTAKIFHNSLTGISPQELQQGFEETLKSFSSYGFQDHESFCEMVLNDKNDTWSYYWGTWRGTAAADSSVLDVPVHLALQFVDGKVVREYAYYDNAILDELMDDDDGDEEGEEGEEHSDD